LPSASLGAEKQGSRVKGQGSSRGERGTRNKEQVRGEGRGARVEGRESSAGGLRFGMYEPIHGSAPSRAGQDLANPIASIMSTAMMLRHSLGLETEAAAIESAVESVLESGYRTYDIMEEGRTKVGTSKMGDLICKAIAG
ncbi:MAG: isocitrate/isopropylmalate family dehydrogenase, partial [Dehalococcoidia bacterium]|nr:isocitrate/isopropylmalate family dehydrogenase [Dehalococcoidia bacterium]